VVRCGPDGGSAPWALATALDFLLRLSPPRRASIADHAALGPQEFVAAARVRAGLALLIAAVLWREIAPTGVAGIQRDLSWIPFATIFEYDRQATIAVLFRKTFEYGAIV
jgi:hypothetical protein